MTKRLCSVVADFLFYLGAIWPEGIFWRRAGGCLNAVTCTDKLHHAAKTPELQVSCYQLLHSPFLRMGLNFSQDEPMDLRQPLAAELPNTIALVITTVGNAIKERGTKIKLLSRSAQNLYPTPDSMMYQLLLLTTVPLSFIRQHKLAERLG